MTTAKLLSVAKQAALFASKIHLRYFQKNPKIMHKGEIDLVTEADIKSDKAIRKIIFTHFPEHQIISEELETKKTSSHYIWVIDPIDGTNNYAHGYPHFCVSIGILFKNQPLVGVIYNPISKEMFTAVKGKGAFLGTKRISVSQTKTVKMSLIATGWPYDRPAFRKTNLNITKEIYDNAMGIRRGGSATLDLCYVACGRIDGYIEATIKPWDIAAGALIVKEAGGKITTREGRKLPIDVTSVLATNKKIHNQCLKLFGGEKK